MSHLLRRFVHPLCFAALLASCGPPGADMSGKVNVVGGEDDVAVGKSAFSTFDPTPDYAALTAGATSIDSGSGVGVSPLVLTGAMAFPLLIDESQRTFGAAARAGLGRVLVFGHDNYVNASIKTGHSTQILMNAIKWMSTKASPVIGLDASLSALRNVLTTAGYTTQTVTPSTLGSVDVYINRAGTVYSDAECDAVRQFIANGGGFIYGGQAWSYSGSVVNFTPNKMLSGAGILVAKASDISAGVDAIAATPPSMLLHSRVGLAALRDQATGVANLSASAQTLAASAVARAVDQLPLTVKEFWDEAVPYAATLNPRVSTVYPIVVATDFARLTAVRIQYRLSQDLPASEITANINAATFPGAVPAGATRETIAVTIDGTYAGYDTRYNLANAGNPVWRTTGGYAAAGEIVTVSIPPALANMGLSAQIGAHTDNLSAKAQINRFPQIVRSYPLTSAVTSIASAFGGPVYITLPAGRSLGPVPVTVTNVVRAPLYVHKQTTLLEWRTSRDYPAPWAELVSDKIIIMVPSSEIRTLADPGPLMDRWGDIMDAMADLASVSHTRNRPERYLTDVQISAGSQHSGYPIMGQLVNAPGIVNVLYIGASNGWGNWHEVGHNHQWNPWVLPGTSESSVNLFSTYVAETLFNIPRARGNGALTPTNRANRINTYATGGRNYATWGSDAWLPLEMYLQLQQWFGWQPFKDLNTDYLLLTPAASPTADQAKLDTWALRFAQKVGKNLGPFFRTTWGMPVSQPVLDQIALLAPWPVSSAPIGLEIDPNDTCAQAQTATAPVLFDPLTLSTQADVDWFALPADAAQVGKAVHVVTAPGQTNTNTVVEVYTGSCAALTSLGGPSSDAGNHEDWLSSPLPAAGTIYVRVSYSTRAYLGSQYNLTITYQ